MSLLCTKIKPLILVGCSGSGRSAIIFHLTRNLPHKFERLISHTTRKPRPNQRPNKDFYFVDKKWVNDNMDNFVTLTYSSNQNYYGLTGEQVARVMSKNKIPIFKMTIDAYAKNIEKDQQPPASNPNRIASEEQDPNMNKYCSIIKINRQLDLPNCLRLLRAKNIECNALYITLPSLKELEKRLKYSPFSRREQEQKIRKAKEEYQEVSKYFDREDVIGKYFQQQPQGAEFEEFEDIITKVQSRLFQLY